ncbi:MAG: hypothetical protein ACOY0T_11810 [Myxococcota bacterium]
MAERGTETVWHWLSPDGKEAQGSQADLAARLSSQTLPASTLVWKKTWADWMPANRVTVLASALPASARLPAREPLRDLSANEPPPPPRRAEMRSLSAVQGDAVKTFDSPLPGTGPMRHTRPAAAEARAPIPTLADEDLPNATDTLRPAGAVPPPPRGVPRPGAFVPAATSERSETATATPIPGIRVGRRPSNPMMPAAAPIAAAAPFTAAATLQASAAEASAAPQRDTPRDPSQISGMQPRSLVAPQAPSTAPPQAQIAPASPLPSSVGSTTSSLLPGAEGIPLGLRIALGFLSALCVLLAIALVFALRALGNEPELAANSKSAPSAAPQVAPVAVAPTPGCTLRAPAAKLAGSVERSIEPRFLDLGADRVAIGFAATRSQAAGIVVQLAQLDSNAVFDEARERPVLGVSPVSAEPLVFNADRDDGTLAMPHSLDTTPRTVLGFTPEGLAKSVDGQAPELIWATPREVSTEPRVARAGSHGYALAFRQGGLSGRILSGWLGADVKPTSELLPVNAGARWVGSPAVAARDGALLLAFAARDSESEAWRIRLGKASTNKPVEAVTVHSTPNEGLGNGAIAPTLAALGKDRWVLQWTQGSAGQYRVYVQELGPDLRPLGAAVAASPKGASAGLGAVRVRGNDALSVFVLTVGGRDELWGASVTCH